MVKALSLIYLCQIFLLPFLHLFLTVKSVEGQEKVERWGLTCSKGPQLESDHGCWGNAICTLTVQQSGHLIAPFPVYIDNKMYIFRYLIATDDCLVFLSCLDMNSCTN